MATNPDFYIEQDFIADKDVNKLLNDYNKIFKNAFEILPINTDYENIIILSQLRDMLEDAIKKNKKLSIEDITDMLNDVEGIIYYPPNKWRVSK